MPPVLAFVSPAQASERGCPVVCARIEEHLRPPSGRPRQAAGPPHAARLPGARRRHLRRAPWDRIGTLPLSFSPGQRLRARSAKVLDRGKLAFDRDHAVRVTLIEEKIVTAARLGNEVTLK